MPTFKHPCPYCGKFIDKTVRACPFCSQADPFAPKRCLACRKIVEDPNWVSCPSCGASLIAPPPPPPGTVPAAGAGTAAAGAAPGVCPNCGYAKTPPGKTNCFNCGKPLAGIGAGAGEPLIDPAVTKLDPPPPPRPSLYVDPSAPAAQATAVAGKCSGCGAPLAAGSRFCTICGTMTAS